MIEVDYLRRRMRQELESADLAESDKAKQAHRVLAARYWAQAVAELRDTESLVVPR